MINILLQDKTQNSYNEELLKSLINEMIESGEISVGGGIKSIQRGNHTFTSTSNATITINSIDPSKCEVKLNNSILGYGGWYYHYYGLPGDFSSAATSGSGHNYGYTYGARVISLNSTSLVISPNYYAGTSGNTFGTVNWEIIEYN